MNAGNSQRPQGSVDLLEDLGQRHEVAALLNGGGLGPASKFFGERAPFMLVVVLQAQQCEHRRPNVGVVGPSHAVHPCLIDSGADHTQPDGGDLRLLVAVVPGKPWDLCDTVGSRGNAVAAGGGAGNKVVWVSENGEARGPE